MTDWIAPARASSSVILLRPGRAEPEVFLVRRHQRSGFAEGAYVFPGGGVLPSDLSPAAATLYPDLSPAQALALLIEREPESAAELDEPTSMSYWIAGVRELLEEAGVLLHAPVEAGEPAAPDLAALRAEVLSAPDFFPAALSSRGLGLCLDDLIYFSHWRTPVQLPKRYETRFFLATLPAGQEASHCGIETTEGLWMTPRQALDRAEAGQLHLVYATRAHLVRLAEHDSLDDLLEFARAKPIHLIDPSIAETGTVIMPAGLETCW